MWYLLCRAVKLHLLVSVVFMNTGWLSNSIRILGLAGNISLSYHYTALNWPLWESALHKWKAHAEALKRNNPVLQRKTISICRSNLKTLCRCSRGADKGEETGWVISLSGVCCVCQNLLLFNIIKGQAIGKKHPHPLKGHNPKALANLDNWKDFLSVLKQGTQLAAPSFLCTLTKRTTSIPFWAHLWASQKVNVWESAAVLAADAELKRWCFLCTSVSINLMIPIFMMLLIFVSFFVFSWCLVFFLEEALHAALSTRGTDKRQYAVWENSKKKRQ